MFNIMIVEDDDSIRHMLKKVLERHSYQPVEAASAEEGLELMDSQHIDMIILDLMLPGMDGYEFARTIRDGGSTVPILMATAMQLSEDKKRGFAAGCDDYMTKPVDTEEMMWRIQALLRRAQIMDDRKIDIDGVVLDYDALTVTRGDESVTLPQKEFYLLFKLLSYPNKVFTRLQLMDEIWGYDSESDDTTINVHINRLRRRFENYPEFEIKAVRGLGYKAVKKS